MIQQVVLKFRPGATDGAAWARARVRHSIIIGNETLRKVEKPADAARFPRRLLGIHASQQDVDTTVG